MIENFLIQSGLKCGTVKNFNTSISEDVRRKDYEHWYFLTPLKISDKGGNLKETTINLAYPFKAVPGDLSEADVLKRLFEIKSEYELNLICFLRKYLLVQSFSFSIIPFWANEKGERTDRKTFGNSNIHILNAIVTIRYRENWLNCTCN